MTHTMSQRYSAARNDRLDARKYSVLAAKLVHLEYGWLSDASLDHHDDETCDRVDTSDHFCTHTIEQNLRISKLRN